MAFYECKVLVDEVKEALKKFSIDMKRVEHDVLYMALEHAYKASVNLLKSRTEQRTHNLERGIGWSAFAIADNAGKLFATARTRKGKNYASYIEEGTPPHFIRARPGGWMKFQMNDQTVFKKVVFHPGNKPYRYLEHGAAVGEKDAVDFFIKRVAELTANF